MHCNGKRKSQSAIEFVSTYSFVFLMIAIIIVLLFAFSSVPTKTLPFQCTAFSGFSCVDVVYTAMGTSSQLQVSLTDAQPGVVSISAFNAKIKGIAVIGTCTPSTLLPGTTVTCTATFPFAAGVGSIYTGVFNISANYCTNGASNISNTTCKAGSSFTYAGSLTTQAQQPTTTTVQYIYCVGDVSFGNTVYYAPISSTGVGTWTHTTNYPIQMYYAGCSIYSGYIYCAGTGNNVYYSPISSTGAGAWSSSTSYPIAMTYAGCSIYGGYIYCVGSAGTSSHNEVYYSPVSSTGVGAWTSTTSYPVGIYMGGCSIYSGYIYCVGGTVNYYAVYYSPVSSTGVGAWTSTTSYPTQIYNGGCSIYSGYIYCVGSSASPSTQVYYSPVSSTGVGAWTSTTSYPISFSAAGCSIYSGYIYCVGGSATNNVYYSPVSSTGVGTWTHTTNYPIGMGYGSCEIPGSGGGLFGGGGSSASVTTTSSTSTSTTISPFTYAWTSQSNTLAVGIGQDLRCVTANNYIYCMGGDVGYTAVQYASIPSGGLPTSAWTSQANTLVAQAYYHSCVTANNYIYCMGGAGAQSAVQYASIPSGGGPTSTWTSQANTLAVGEYYFSCVTANNYIYCMGGASSPSAVQYASIPSGGGPTSTWTSQANTLAVGVYGLDCVTANNYIYCMGGYYGGGYTTVQYASIPSGGGPTSAWTSQANTLAVGENMHSCVTVNNYIYCMGGSLSPQNEVQYASIPSGGGPTSAWTSQTANTLAVAEYHFGCVTVNSYIYCLGGILGGTAPVQYALS